MSAPTTTMTQTHYDPHFVDMMRGTPPPTWESTCLKLEAKLADRNQYIKELEGRLRVLWDKYNSALDDITADSKENSESNAIIRELQLKIKRLEEAGDATANLLLKGDLNDHTALMHTYSMWTKAKEAKL